jgi:hypothetical protein
LKLGILAFGSLIWEPGEELSRATAEQVSNVLTPFKIEFARTSRRRGGGPTLVRVHKGGANVKGMILVMKEVLTREEAIEMLKRREGGAPIATISNFHGFETVLYADPVPNIDNPSPKMLAQLAIDSVLNVGVAGRDGITYLMRAKDLGLVTPLMSEYEEEILLRSAASSLPQALERILAQSGD